MRVYHLNCGSFRLLGGETPTASGPPASIPGVTHCVLVETGNGLLLLDSGFGMRDCVAPTPFMRLMMTIGGCARDPEETAVRHVERLGYVRADVKHIVLTHFHYDHAGGLPDFPHAQVHIYRDEYEAVTRPHGANERLPYRREHWAHGPNWVIHSLEHDQWFGFAHTHVVELGETSFFLVPLPGHTRGHSGIALRLPEGWLFHCGDAYIFHGEVDPAGPFHPRHYRLQRALFSANRSLRQIGKQAPRLRVLACEHGDEVRTTCSHDPWELEKLQGGRTGSIQRG